MANHGTENSEQKPELSPQESAEVDAVFERFEKNERARKIKVFLLALAVVAAGAAVFLTSVVFRENRLTANIDMEAIDTEAAAKTNDPQCRDMIAQVDDLSARFFKLEPQLEEHLLGDDPEKIKALRDEIARIQQRIDEINEYSLKANLRFETSRTELDEWFDYVALEFTFVDRLGREQLELLNKAEAAQNEADAGVEGEPKPDADVEGVVVAEGKKKRNKKEAPKKTPLERKQAALVALHDSFQNFRIWHTAAAHPCGGAEEGETGWVPAEKDAK
ncbi:hypothetical protein [Bradymonas sediminis]|uniref:Uncharacterized protein n=1 Tax=Bradymonas sediminis TaxID=1548548 RepID=A0A2Z4FNR1_9DELT|nr:hypothetical protein [Bradymonas sediminis]AWV90510.1 hypothetical protein DN745_14715 [Bradymonas sediminis]TDP72097.1 hypothetical protein DFR33_10777 [Bradymonas sediminis]